ncbi:hypothetical protein [Paenibacillus radicis (ex Gao et al. 2016)]|uniref:DUF4367 domain-containing protein n=1 Tax=Paenibacillus radicis (ex Gao et al. 2016) TaxID=1737354 RepID=A0A917H7L0_9BACL|nr:hypothetical protein [Paenibacillus radicis (ex Gao et al. 2016)]GGG70041.1 hypothetical protein GCM10010918_26610 [Paenibacillus radicis (ex Gao et al. 2016)]
MEHSDPDWYKALQTDIVKEKRFDNDFMQKIRLRTTQAESLRKKNRRRRVIFASLASLFLVMAILFTSSGTDIFHLINNEFDEQNLSSTVTNSEQEPQNSMHETRGGLADTIEELPFQTINQGEQPLGPIDLSEVPDNEIFIPRLIKIPSSSEKESETIIEPTISAENMENVGFILRTSFFTTSGVNFRIVQAPATMNEEETIQSLLNSYPLEEKEQTKINGHVVIYVDGEERAVAHLITQNHFFTVSTTNGTIEDCFSVLEQLKKEDDTSNPVPSLKRIDLSLVNEPINIPLDLADAPVEHSNTSLSSNFQIVKLERAYAQQSSQGTDIVAIYQLSDDKHEVIFSQSLNILKNEEAAVEDTKSWYNPDDVRVIEINGHSAVIEDSPDRKLLHLITDTHFYVVASPGIQNVEYLIELAGKIKLP